MTREDLIYMTAREMPEAVQDRVDDLARTAARGLRDDVAEIAPHLDEFGSCLVDGSAFSPAWRRLAEGEEAWRLAERYPSAAEYFGEALDEEMRDEVDPMAQAHGAVVYWEDGCLLIVRAEDDADEDADHLGYR